MNMKLTTYIQLFMLVIAIPYMHAAARTYRSQSYTGTVQVEKIMPCGAYAAFLSNVMGYTVASTDECAELRLIIPRYYQKKSHPTAKIFKEEVAEYASLEEYFEQYNPLSTDGSSTFYANDGVLALAPTRLLQDCRDGSIAPTDVFAVKPKYFHPEEKCIGIQATCIGHSNNSFDDVMKIAQEVSRMDESQLRATIKQSPRINTEATALIYSWKRFFLSSASWVDTLRIAAQETLLAANSSNQKS